MGSHRTPSTLTSTQADTQPGGQPARASGEAAPPGRIVALDIARGIAIFGTLGTNIWIFSHPAGMLGYLADPTQGASGAGRIIEQVLMALANGKFLGLLTLMFGIGLAIQRDSAIRRGNRWPGSYPWRAALLLVDGVLHYLLVVEFDVLMGYAVTGLVVAWVIAGTPRAQRAWIIVTAAVHTLLIFALTALLMTTSSSPAMPSAADNPYANGSWLDLVALRIDQAALFRLEPVLIFAMGIALFTLGARLLEAGLFHSRGASLRGRLIALGASALLLDLTLQLAVPNTILLCRYVLAPLVSLGLLALIAGHWLNRRPGFVARHLGKVGRMALSSYIAQNLICSVLFYGWGFGLNQVGPQLRAPVTVAALLGIWVLMMALAELWLRRFERGPVEWLWSWSYQALSGAER